MGRLVLLLGVLALVSCSSSTPWQSFDSRRISARYPPGWFATKHALTPVTSPVQALALASYPLPGGNSGADGCSPKAALDGLPPKGALVFGWEFPMPSPSGLRPKDFPARPSHFRLTAVGNSECVPGSYEVRFREAGRFFQIHVKLGPHASSGTKAKALRILDSIKVDTPGR